MSGTLTSKDFPGANYRNMRRVIILGCQKYDMSDAWISITTESVAAGSQEVGGGYFETYVEEGEYKSVHQ